jgi:hypothetical protein
MASTVIVGDPDALPTPFIMAAAPDFHPVTTTGNLDVPATGNPDLHALGLPVT